MVTDKRIIITWDIVCILRLLQRGAGDLRSIMQKTKRDDYSYRIEKQLNVLENIGNFSPRSLLDKQEGHECI